MNHVQFSLYNKSFLFLLANHAIAFCHHCRLILIAFVLLLFDKMVNENCLNKWKSKRIESDKCGFDQVLWMFGNLLEDLLGNLA